MTSEEIHDRERMSAWHCVMALRSVVDGGAGFDLKAVACAAFHAGEAWAYYQSRDAVGTLEGKLKELRAKKEK